MGTGTQETDRLMRALQAVSHMQPETAWDLEAQLIGLARASIAFADAVADYAVTLDTERIDPRVTGHLMTATEALAATSQAVATAGTAFRALYAPYLEAAEAGVRQPSRADFFNPNK